ncbi:hypothetical protein BGX26_002500, partial [Mortierella sp. AD094]
TLVHLHPEPWCTGVDNFTGKKRCLNLTTGRLYLGCLFDYGIAADDLFTLGVPKKPVPRFEASTYSSAYSLWIPQPIRSWLVRTAGELAQGARTSCPCSIPPILQGPKVPLSFIQAFLGGSFGGDGCSPTWGLAAGSLDSQVQFVRSTEIRYLESLRSYFQFVAALLVDGFGIESIRTYFAPSNIPGRVAGSISLSAEATSTFANIIGFRGCVGKSYPLAVVASFQGFRRIHCICRSITIEAVSRELVQANQPRDKFNRIGNVDVDNTRLLQKNIIQTVTQKQVLSHTSKKSQADLLKDMGAWDRQEVVEENGIKYKKKYITERHGPWLPVLYMEVVQILPSVQRQVARLSNRGVVVNGVPVVF